MAGSAQSIPAAGELITITDPLRLAVASYLARFKGQTRAHTESDLRCYLDWCTAHRLAPLTADRAHVELFVRWMQETRTLKPSTVSRGVSVVAGFYRTAVIEDPSAHSRAWARTRPIVVIRPTRRVDPAIFATCGARTVILLYILFRVVVLHHVVLRLALLVASYSPHARPLLVAVKV